MTRIQMKTGDRRPVPDATVTVLDANGVATPVDLTGASATFVMFAVNATVAKINDATAVIDNPTAGHVYYAWGATDTTDPGLFLGEFKITFQDGKEMTAPNKGFIEVEIQESLS